MVSTFAEITLLATILLPMLQILLNRTGAFPISPYNRKKSIQIFTSANNEMRSFFELINKPQFSKLYYAMPFILAVTLYIQYLFPLNIQHPDSTLGLLWLATFFVQGAVFIRLSVSLRFRTKDLLEFTSKRDNLSRGDLSLFATLYSKIKTHKVFFISVLLPIFISSNFYTNIPTVVYPVGKFTLISLLGDSLVIFSFAVIFSQKGLYPYFENFLFKTVVLSKQKWFKVEITFKIPQSKGISTILGSVVSIGPYLSIKRNDGLVEVIRWNSIVRIALDMQDHAIIREVK
ncbi:MAG: hypothetical protein ACYDCP_04915 [Thermoplasmataceae archaeon]